MNKLLENSKLLELAKEHKEVQDLIDYVKVMDLDIESRFYFSLKSMVGAICEEMDSLKDGESANCRLLLGDDKAFERVKSLMVDSEKIFMGLKRGRGLDDEDDVKKKKLKNSTAVAV